MKRWAAFLFAWVLGAGCGSSAPPAPGTCRGVCDREAAASCAMFDVAACRASCDSSVTDSGVMPACQVALTTFLTCAARASYTCSSVDQPMTEGCTAEALAFIECNSSDAGPDAHE